MVTFLFIDVLATNYVLAAIITYILNAVSVLFLLFLQTIRINFLI